jgi:hypothetical protein
VVEWDALFDALDRRMASAVTMKNDRFPYDIDCSETADAIFDAWRFALPNPQQRLTRNAWIERSGIADILKQS